MSIKYKLIPVDYLDLPGTEAWLEEMASKGLYLEKLGRSFASFYTDEPTAVRYHLEPEFSDNDKQEEFDTVMAEKGWEVICPDKENKCWVYRADDPHAPEVHTDPIVQSKALSKLTRRETRNMAISGALLIAALVYMFWFLIQEASVLKLVQQTSVYHLLFPFLAPIGVVGCVISALRLRDLRAIQKQLAAGFPFRREGRKAKTNYLLRLFFPILVVVFLLSTVLQFYAVAQSWEKPLAEAQLPFSMPAITELTGDIELDPETFFTQEFMARFYNRVEYDWYPLADIYEADYYLTAAEGEKVYRFIAKWYDLRLPFLAKGLTEDLAGHTPAVDASAQGLDHLLLSEQPGRSTLFACAGDKVLMLKWSAEDIQVDLIPMAQEILTGK